MLTGQESHFDDLFTNDADPWRYRTAFVERRRHQLMLAMLEAERYRSVFEPGCANGALTELIASRADHVLAWDTSARAVDRAADAVGSLSNVRIEHGSVPNEWPDGVFDLVVLSDFLYYLDADDARRVVLRSLGSSAAGGLVLVGHWLGSAHDFRIAGGAEVHEVVTGVLGPPTGPMYRDDRQIIAAWRT